MPLKLTSLVIAFISLTACAADPPPAAADPSSSPASTTPEQSSGTIDLSTSEEAKALTLQQMCNANSVMRQCWNIPDDAACKSAVDAAWPGCTNGLVIHEGKHPDDRETGRKVGRCVTLDFSKRFTLVPTDSCKAVLAKTQ